MAKYSKIYPKSVVTNLCGDDWVGQHIGHPSQCHAVTGRQTCSLLTSVAGGPGLVSAGGVSVEPAESSSIRASCCAACCQASAHIRHQYLTDHQSINQVKIKTIRSRNREKLTGIGAVLGGIEDLHADVAHFLLQGGVQWCAVFSGVQWYAVCSGMQCAVCSVQCAVCSVQCAVPLDSPPAWDLPS